ncbi:MAG: UrcA family protein [Pseudomonadota bacterium]
MYKTLLVCAVLICAPGTWADQSYTITYSQTELTTQSGVAVVHDRLVRAARNYCPGYLQMKSHSAVDACVSGVVEDLIAKIDQPMLTAYAEMPESERDKVLPMLAAKDK